VTLIAHDDFLTVEVIAQVIRESFASRLGRRRRTDIRHKFRDGGHLAEVTLQRIDLIGSEIS
jgi:hypothetical protein